MKWILFGVFIQVIATISLRVDRLPLIRRQTNLSHQHYRQSVIPRAQPSEEMSRNLIPWHKKVRVLQRFSEIGLWAIEKPIGVLSHPNHMKFNEPSILNAPYHIKTESYNIEKAGTSSSETSLYLLHRLDKATSGVLLLADSAQTATTIKSLFKTRQIQKTYVAIVHSPPFFAKDKFTWIDQYEFKKGMGKQVATTEVTVLKHNRDHNLSQLLLEPKTGFTHQLRIQCALHGVPILGDDIHGNFALNKALLNRQSSIPPLKNRLYLHARRINFTLKAGGQSNVVDISSSMPDEFLRLIPS